jgi:hypothetical protein
MKHLRIILAVALAILALSGCSLFQRSTVVVQNNSSYTVDTVYISETSNSTWGSDLLSTTIPPGGSHSFGQLVPGDYDLRAEETLGGFWQKFGVTLVANDTYTWTLY